MISALSFRSCNAIERLIANFKKNRKGNARYVKRGCGGLLKGSRMIPTSKPAIIKTEF